MWHVQDDPELVAVSPDIAGRLVTLPDSGALPAAPQGDSVAWFGEAVTGTYCGSDYATVKQTPEDGCTSSQVQSGTLTSPPFSLAGQTAAVLVFEAWWEIEAVNADISDLMRVQYSVDGGASWVGAGALNPLDPAWGGRHQVFTDAGARQSGSWQTYAADLTPAAGLADVRVRFSFDTLDRLRNGFRGLLVDGVSVVDGLGATVTDPGGGPFTDASPGLTVEDVVLVQDDDGDWSVDFTLTSSHPTTHDVGADWEVHGHSGHPDGGGHATITAGQTSTPVSVPVSATDAPYVVTIANPSGATIVPGAGSGATPGGAVPLVGLTGATASDAGDGDISVLIGIGLTGTTTQTVSVDYTVTGADGTPGGGGTLSIAPPGTGATTTLALPAEHGPYTIGLSNARNALLDPAGSSASTNPLVGTVPIAGTSASGGSQLVLGAREAGGSVPSLNRTFFLTYVSGTLRYHRPGGPYTPLAAGTVELPLGSVVDATRGHARVTVESDPDGTLQSGEFWDGKFGVFQIGGSHPIAEMRLAGGDYSSCAGAASKKHAKKRRHGKARRPGRAARKRGKAGTVRRLWASSKGRFRTRGRFAAATVRGTKWQTEDLCLATRISVEEGVVSVFDFRRKRTVLVRAGDSRTIGALQSARFRKRRGIHAPRLSRS